MRPAGGVEHHAAVGAFAEKGHERQVLDAAQEAADYAARRRRPPRPGDTGEDDGKGNGERPGAANPIPHGTPLLPHRWWVAQ